MGDRMIRKHRMSESVIVSDPDCMKILKSKKNGELLRDVESAGYDVLLKVDRGIPHERNVAGRKLSVVTIR